MCINYLNHYDLHHPQPLQAAIRLSWGGIVVRNKNQAVWPVQINRELASAITLQFVTPTWQITHRIKVRGRVKVIESST